MWPPPPGLPDPQADKQHPKRLPAGYRVLIGFGGALVGIVLGLTLAFLVVAEVSGGELLGEAFAFMAAAPIGMMLGVVFGTAMAFRISRYLRRDDLGVAARRKKTSLVVALVAGLPALVVGAFQVGMHRDDPPSDQQMLANFRRHQATFNQLVQMTQADKGLTRVGDNWTTPDDPLSIGVTPSRINQYRKLFSVVGTKIGLGADTGSVEFYYYGYGSAISSDTDKGYIYTKEAPTPLLPTLDGCHPSGENLTFAYRHIEGNWYLYYKYLPG